MSVPVVDVDRGGHWVRLEADGRARCQQCDWESDATGAAAADEGLQHSTDSRP